MGPAEVLTCETGRERMRNYTVKADGTGVTLSGEGAPAGTAFLSGAADTVVVQSLVWKRGQDSGKAKVLFDVLVDADGAEGCYAPISPNKQLQTEWYEYPVTNLSHSAPVLCCFDGRDRNVVTLAVSEVREDVRIRGGIQEESGRLHYSFTCDLPDGEVSGKIAFRLDLRGDPYESALADTAAWWDEILKDPALPVPDSARLPMYSTWYAWHQDMQSDELLSDYVRAAAIGMKSVIIDDGWQTSDNNRGYAFCGDWKPAGDKFPDFRDHVSKIHTLGMKCIVWFNVAAIGEKSAAFQMFQGRLLHRSPKEQTGVLDPRYPEVREYLTALYAIAVQSYGLDGLKLDFIDLFQHYEDTPDWNTGMDIRSIQDAAYRLMLQIETSLRKIRPDLLVEFRQNYIGPAMRRFGNFFRVRDCPMSGYTNRVGIADIRLLAGNSAVHSDMLMWARNERPENIARQLIDCIFGNLQISMRLDRLSEEQMLVLWHYLRFSVKYRKVLQEGTFTARDPLHGYTFLQSVLGSEGVGALYQRGMVVQKPAECRTYWILNGTA
ncbi:MAG TPA: alpha-galactosidase [Lachnospiraceae bacterium]|nr:alpha-galactosidase [Lachnospiraceae bacterium]